MKNAPFVWKILKCIKNISGVTRVPNVFIKIALKNGNKKLTPLLKNNVLFVLLLTV